jgi:hypothetical protein
MRLGKKAQSAEATVGRAVDTLVERLVGSSPKQPLEILHALLEDVERQVQPAGRGRWVFPFNRVTVEVLAPTRDARARLAGVIGDATALRARIADKLQPTCRLGQLDIRIVFRTKRPAHWHQPEYHVQYERVDAEPAGQSRPAVGPSAIELIVTNGIASQRRFSFKTDRIDVGRGTEVLDTRQRLLRRNQIAFPDDGHDVNQTVSRRHAHILYRESSREYRLYDDNSARGTSIVRSGATIPVPPGGRGVGLRSDDELILGQARLRVKIAAPG